MSFIHRKCPELKGQKPSDVMETSSLHPLPPAPHLHLSLTSMSAEGFARLLFFFSLWRWNRWKKGVQHFRGKKSGLAAKYRLSVPGEQGRGGRNERKQVHLPQVYNPEITVCSGACLTTLWAACASLLISLAPAVHELI